MSPCPHQAQEVSKERLAITEALKGTEVLAFKRNWHLWGIEVKLPPLESRLSFRDQFWLFSLDNTKH